MRHTSKMNEKGKAIIWQGYLSWVVSKHAFTENQFSSEMNNKTSKSTNYLIYVPTKRNFTSESAGWQTWKYRAWVCERPSRETQSRTATRASSRDSDASYQSGSLQLLRRSADRGNSVAAAALLAHLLLRQLLPYVWWNDCKCQHYTLTFNKPQFCSLNNSHTQQIRQFQKDD